MTKRPSIFMRTLSTPLILILVLAFLLALAAVVNSGPFNQVVIDALVKVTLVVGLYVFIGNYFLCLFVCYGKSHSFYSF